ncbi:nucleotidyltransferase family protein [Neobacillus sp. PS3-40]|uniref:nucleotidyltransferase family protein n=1 Tax=Neobacillus sp. PS3-40 TaxID=3070679 RepID=UPI0027DEDFCE|nr:nucleotidyltransferase family protein [Neobacillus sp. PS3-40]WML43942.1 nucleotidyltransferase family protein [Neobacillus sp. PS3-40]
MVKCAAILLTAGKSTRMGCLKSLLPWEGMTLLQHQLCQLGLSKVDQLVAVLGYQSRKLIPYFENTSVHFVFNEQFELGKTESIKKGLLSIKEGTDCIMIISVDQPVNQLLLDSMINHFVQTKSKIIIPVYNGKRGHPILFSTELVEDLLRIKEETNGLKAVLHKWKNEINELNVEDRSVLYNFNSPKDYEEGFFERGLNCNERF